MIPRAQLVVRDRRARIRVEAVELSRLHAKDMVGHRGVAGNAIQPARIVMGMATIIGQVAEFGGGGFGIVMGSHSHSKIDRAGQGERVGRVAHPAYPVGAGVSREFITLTL